MLGILLRRSLAMEPRLALSSDPRGCLSLRSVGTGMSHHTSLSVVLRETGGRGCDLTCVPTGILCSSDNIGGQSRAKGSYRPSRSELGEREGSESGGPEPAATER